MRRTIGAAYPFGFSARLTKELLANTISSGEGGVISRRSAERIPVHFERAGQIATSRYIPGNAGEICLRGQCEILPRNSSLGPLRPTL